MEDEKEEVVVLERLHRGSGRIMNLERRGQIEKEEPRSTSAKLCVLGARICSS
jgi:hypothetical protein